MVKCTVLSENKNRAIPNDITLGFLQASVQDDIAFHVKTVFLGLGNNFPIIE